MVSSMSEPHTGAIWGDSSRKGMSSAKVHGRIDAATWSYRSFWMSDRQNLPVKHAWTSTGAEIPR